MDGPPASRYRRDMSRPQVGGILREWRHRRRRSQLDLSVDVGVSARHLSFVETGRSRPSPELLLALATHLDVPLRERNSLLLAAGYAPRYSETALDDLAMARARSSLERMLDAHDPYPGVVIDRAWNVVLANDAAQGLLSGVPAHVLEPSLNVFRLCLHPDGLASRTLNLDEWAGYLLDQVHRSAQLTGDTRLQAIEEEVRAYPGMDALGLRSEVPPAGSQLLVPFRMASPAGELSLFTTLTTFGTPRDITLEELSVELFYPADDATDAILRSAPAQVTASGG